MEPIRESNLKIKIISRCYQTIVLFTQSMGDVINKLQADGSWKSIKTEYDDKLSFYCGDDGLIYGLTRRKDNVDIFSENDNTDYRIFRINEEGIADVITDVNWAGIPTHDYVNLRKYGRYFILMLNYDQFYDKLFIIDASGDKYTEIDMSPLCEDGNYIEKLKEDIYYLIIENVYEHRYAFLAYSLSDGQY